eukprot:scaffold114833_cov51-Phaeocystis_antarctica.AAC.2
MQIWLELGVEIAHPALQRRHVPREELGIGGRRVLEGVDSGDSLLRGRAPVAAEQEVHRCPVRRHSRRGA